MDVQRASLLFVCFTPPNFQKRKFVKRKFGQLEICPAEETFEEEIWAVVWTIFLNNSCFCFTKYMVNRKFKSGFQVKFQLASEDSLRIQPSNTVSGTHSGMTQRMLLNLEYLCVHCFASGPLFSLGLNKSSCVPLLIASKFHTNLAFLMETLAYWIHLVSCQCAGVLVQ